jgi:hypothetical protein
MSELRMMSIKKIFLGMLVILPVASCVTIIN